MGAEMLQEQVDGALVGDRPVLMPPGTYRVRFDDWDTVNYFNRQPKVVCRFTVCTEGKWFGAKLVRWYNVKALTGKPRSRGRFKVAWGQDLAREYLPLVSGSPRKDGIALSKLKPLLLDAEIETVTCDRRQRALDPVLHYSVIRSIRLSPDVAQPI
ncbi:MAG: hypothetical protein IPO74_05460 [Thermomonas sp.]|nr:hypothetical protein [Thermomonas sp.]